jgi:heptosyltransferase I
MPSFLIVKTSAIGDVIQTLPVLEYLRMKEPRARIGWVVEKSCADLLAAHPLVDDVYAMDSKRWRKFLRQKNTWDEIKDFFSLLRKDRYDILFDLQGNCKSGLITLFARAREKVGYSWNTVSEKPNCLATSCRYPVSKGQNARERYLSLLQSHFGDRTPFLPRPVVLKLKPEEQVRLETFPAGRIMVAFGFKWGNKQIPLPILQDFLDRIDQKLHIGFLFPYADEKERKIAQILADRYAGRAEAVGEMSLPFWQALMSKCQSVIAVDSAALHLCATTKTPSFSVFGASSAKAYAPSDQMQHVAVQGICPYKERFEKRCRLLRTCATGACMSHFSGEELFKEFLKLRHFQ